MIDHVLLNVRDLDGTRRFYELALAPLGYRVVAELDTPGCVFAAGDGSMFGLRIGTPSSPVHVAFGSPDRRTVDDFHSAGLGAGGADNGAPGLREQVHPDYYAAYVLDPEDNNIEAVCQTAQ